MQKASNGLIAIFGESRRYFSKSQLFFNFLKLFVISFAKTRSKNLMEKNTMQSQEAEKDLYYKFSVKNFPQTNLLYF